MLFDQLQQKKMEGEEEKEGGTPGGTESRKYYQRDEYREERGG